MKPTHRSSRLSLAVHHHPEQFARELPMRRAHALRTRKLLFNTLPVIDVGPVRPWSDLLLQRLLPAPDSA